MTKEHFSDREPIEPALVIYQRLLEFYRQKTANCPELAIINETFPEISYEELIKLMLESYQENGRRLIFHVHSLIEMVEQFNFQTLLSASELNQLYLGILYHDSAKLLNNKKFDKQKISELIKYLLDDQYGHSLAMQRLFLYLGLTDLAQVIRHNDQDFIIDINENRITPVQFLFNLLDRLDDSGKPTNLQAKMLLVKKKLEDNNNFDGTAMQLAHQHLAEIYSLLLKKQYAETKNILARFSPNTQKSHKIWVIGRMDGKYHPPIGQYQDTSSAVHIAKAMSQMDWQTTIFHGGNFSPVFLEQGKIQIKATDKDSLEIIISDPSEQPEIILVEGWTSIVPRLKKLKSSENTFLTLIFRAFSGGKLKKTRLNNALQADEIWGVSNAVKNAIDEQIHSEQPLKAPLTRVITNGVNHEIFNENEPLPRIKGKIVYVGAIKEEKGVNLLIEAFRLVKKENPDAELHLIGSGEMYGSETQEIAEKGIVIHGQLSHLELADHFKTAHCCVLLSEPKLFETFGKAIEEAKACGCRVIVSNSGGLPERISSPEVGRVIENLEVETVAKVLNQQLANEPTSIHCQKNVLCDWRIAAIDIITAYYQHLRTKLTN